MSARVRMHIDGEPRDCFERFCRVERIGEWVARVRSVRVRSRHADGRAAEVEFVGIRAGTGEVRYTLAYAYDRAGLRVSWRAREGERDAVAGYATFEPEGTGCRMTYALEHGDRWGTGRVDLQRVVEEIAAAFVAHLSPPR